MKKNKKKDPPSIKNAYDSPVQKQMDILKWVNYFKQIPGISADMCKSDISGYLMNVNVPVCLKTFIRYSKKQFIGGNVRIFTLKDNEKFEVFLTIGKCDLTFSDWEKQMETSCANSWKELYNWCIKLSNEYKSIVLKKD